MPRRVNLAQESFGDGSVTTMRIEVVVDLEGVDLRLRFQDVDGEDVSVHCLEHRLGDAETRLENPPRTSLEPVEMLIIRSLLEGGSRQYGSITPAERPTATRQQRAGQIICCTRASPRARARWTARGSESQISIPLPRLP